MGFALWIDPSGSLAWAQGTHEYRPLGTAVVAVTDQFRNRDFAQRRRIPPGLRESFVGFFGSLETLNAYLASGAGAPARGRVPQLALRRTTPAHLW